MNIVDIIPSIRRELESVTGFLEMVLGRNDIGDSTQKDYINKSHALQRFLRGTEDIILNGVNFNLGNFDERGYVSTSDYKVAETLLQMGVGLPYPEFSLSINIDAAGKKFPMVFIVRSVDVGRHSFFYIVPLFIKKEDLSHSVHPPIVPFGTFQRRLDLDAPGTLEAFFDGGLAPEEVQELFQEDLPLQVMKSESDREKISTYGFSYIFFDESLNDLEVKTSGVDFMNYVMQEYFMKFLFLLNTKGVDMETVPAPTGLNKKRKKRGKYPIREHKVLKFHLPKAMGMRRSTRGDSVMPYHKVRGHTKIYSEENPLFGKHVGPVWCPDHSRGSEEVGHITKDYKLIPRRK